MTTQIWALFQYPPKIEVAAAISIPLLASTALLLQLQKRLLGRRGYAAIGRKGGHRARAVALPGPRRRARGRVVELPFIARTRTLDLA